MGIVRILFSGHWLRGVSLAALLSCTFPLYANNSPDPHDIFLQGWTAYEQSDYAVALNTWLPIAEQGHVNAQINIGVLYDHGMGVAQSKQHAARWYRAAAQQGSAIGQYNLGMFLLEQQDAQAEKEGMDWLRKAANVGHPDAQYQLGVLYSQGTAGSAHIQDAPQWLYKAGVNFISSENTDAARTVIALLNRIPAGEPLAKDLETQAAKWSEPSSDLESETSNNNLSTGTAWPIAWGYAVTNYHVVADKRSLTLVNTQGEEIIATVVATDPTNDIALLSVRDPSKLPPALPLAIQGANLGSSVFTIGFPRVDTMGKSPKLSLGIISSIKGLYDDPSSYQISVPIQPGNSGGPLVNMRGEVVGLITSMLGTVNASSGESQPLPNINYALKVDKVRELLQRTPHQREVTVLTSGSADLETLAGKIQGSILIVMAQ